MFPCELSKTIPGLAREWTVTVNPQSQSPQSLQPIQICLSLMNLKLTGKIAFISGSTKGIGFTIASQLAAEGAHVIVNGRSDETVNSALQQIRKALPEANAEGFAGDMATATATERLLKFFSDVDILVNNPGIYGPKPFYNISDQAW